MESRFHYWQSFIEKNYGIEKARLGLENLKTYIADDVDFIESHAAHIVTVAGTNGKGETISYLAQAFKQQEISYCLWTSPHLLSLAERFQNLHGMIDENDFDRLANDVHFKFKDVMGNISFYEFLFVLFVRWVREQRPQVLLLEVGLGGRLDCVNYFSADLVLIPSISRDHQEYLGARYDQILYEKLGVLRGSAELITSFELKYLREKTNDYCRVIKARYQNLIPDKNDLFFERNRKLALAGLLKLEAEQKMTVSSQNFPHTQSILAGRNEIVQHHGFSCELFGSHNVDGVRKLVQYLCRSSYNIQRNCILLSFSDRSQNDLVTMVKTLKPLVQCGIKVVLTTFTHQRACLRMKELSDLIEGIEYVENWKKYIEQYKSCSQRWVVAGSYYFLAEFKQYFR